MKRVRINAQKVGLTYRNGDFQRILLEGNHWLKFGETMQFFTRSQIYGVFPDMELLLQNNSFAENTRMIRVQAHEIALIFVRGIFNNVLTPGNYFLFEGMVDIEIRIVDLNSEDPITSVDGTTLKHPSVAPYVRNFKVENYEKGLLFREGKFIKEIAAGSYVYWSGSKSVEVSKIDLRNMQLEISGQELLTKDKAALRINFQLEFRVTDCLKALLENRDYTKQLYTKGQLALREVTGSLTLDELLGSREQVGEFVLKSLKAHSEGLGVNVSSAGIRDIILPGEVREIMNQVLVAEKKAQANAIARREESASTRTMLNTAKMMEENSVLFKLKEMEYIEKIADKIGEIKLSGGGAVIDQLAQLLAR